MLRGQPAMHLPSDIPESPSTQYQSRNMRFNSACSDRGASSKGSQQNRSLHLVQRDTSWSKPRKHTSKVRECFLTPRQSVPWAPENFQVLLTPGRLSATASLTLEEVGCFRTTTPNPFLPGTAWKNGFGMVDVEAAAACMQLSLDIFGSNAGLLTTSDTDAVNNGDLSTSCDDDDDPFGFAMCMDDCIGGDDAGVSASVLFPVANSAQTGQLGQQSILREGTPCLEGHSCMAEPCAQGEHAEVGERHQEAAGHQEAGSAGDEDHRHASCG